MVLTAPSTTIIENTSQELIPFEETEDPSIKAHVFRGEENEHLWMDGMTAQDLVNSARMLGVEITALCGFKLIPKHNPDKHDACDRCMKIAAQIWGS